MEGDELWCREGCVLFWRRFDLRVGVDVGELECCENLDCCFLDGFLIVDGEETGC